MRRYLKEYAIELLGTMVGGYNLQGLIDIVSENNELSKLAGDQLKNLVLSVKYLMMLKKSQTQEML